MNSIKNQIQEMYEKAFYDVIDENVNSDKTDYDWIVNLYTEIKNRLLRYVKKDSKTYNLIDSQFDIKLFRQMIENDIFNMESLGKLINTTFYWIESLQAPQRDSETRDSKQRVFSASKEKMVSTFIKEVNKCIDTLDKDLVEYINTQS